MAVLRRVTPANPISSFPATVRPGPTVFDALADGAEAWAGHLDQRARAQAEIQGREQGAAAAGSYTPSNPGVAPGMLPVSGQRAGAPGVTVDNPISPYRGPAGQGAALPISGALDGVDPGLISMAQQAWGYVMPAGSRIEVTTGVSDHSPRNHAPGRAIDFRVVRPDGSVVRWDDEEAVRGAEFFSALGGGGVGAGFDYMGGTHFHWDINDPRVWSDSDGINNRDPRGAVSWASRLDTARQIGVQGLLAQAGVVPPVTSGAGVAVSGGAGDDEIQGNGLEVTASGMEGEILPPTTAIRNETGGLETRPIDMFTSRYDMIRQNAALGAYAAGALNNASLAMTDLRRQFPLDPDGFRQAAQGYISQMMENAPGEIRQQMLSDLQLEAGRTLNGILSARFENTMNRAQSEISARIETTATEYSTLLAAGDAEGAAMARANLESALRYRSSLPGSTWGPEQSNLLIAGAEREAERMRTTQANARQTEIGAMLSDIRRERGDGRVSAHESILFSEEAQRHPEYLATVASVEFGNFMQGSFAQMPAEERAQLIAAERGRAVDDYDRNWLGAMESAHTRLTQLETNDQMTAAAGRGAAVGALDPTNPQTFLTTLAQRRIIADQMIETGFATPDNVRIFTNPDRDMLAPLVGEAADPNTRMEVVSAIIATQGEGTVSALRELGVEESVAQIADLARVTGNSTLLQEGLMGAALRATQQARVGNVSDMLGVADVAEIVNALPANAAMRRTIIEMALDNLAFRAQGGEPTDDQRVEAINAVTGRMGNAGGVQTVFGGMTMLPPGMSPDVVERRLSEAMQPVSAADMRATADGRIEVLGPAPSGGAVRRNDRPVIGTFDTMQEAQASAFGALGQGQPMLGGEPIEPRDLRRGRLVPVMRNGNFVIGVYTLEFDGGFEAEDAEGNVYEFDLNRIMGP